MRKPKPAPRRLLLDCLVKDEQNGGRGDEAVGRVESVMPHQSTDWEEATIYGVTYQRCGGGRRIIRKGRAS